MCKDEIIKSMAFFFITETAAYLDTSHTIVNTVYIDPPRNLVYLFRDAARINYKLCWNSIAMQCLVHLLCPHRWHIEVFLSSHKKVLVFLYGLHERMDRRVLSIYPYSSRADLIHYHIGSHIRPHHTYLVASHCRRRCMQL